jgi:peptidase M50-like protein
MTFALGILAGFLCLAIHELGHLLAGLSFGYPFKVYIVGPLRIDRGPSDKVRLGWNLVPWLYGGMAAALPNRTRGLRWRMAVVAAAGPMANIVLAIVASLLLASLPVSGPWRTELQWIRLLSAVLALNLVPLRNGPFVTDGLRLWRLLAPGDGRDLEMAILSAAAQTQAGVRPRDWDAAWIDRRLAIKDDAACHLDVHLAAAAIAFDRGAYDCAGESYAAAIGIASRFPAYVAGGAFVEAAWFEARRGAGAARARELLARTPKWVLLLTDADRLRAEAAIAFSEGDHERAKALAERALEISSPQSAGPRAWLRDLIAEAGRDPRATTSRPRGTETESGA